MNEQEKALIIAICWKLLQKKTSTLLSDIKYLEIEVAELKKEIQMLKKEVETQKAMNDTLIGLIMQ